MYNFQSLLGLNSNLMAMGPLGPISSDVTQMVNPEKYIKPAKKETTKTPGLKYDPRSGTMIGENAPEGFKRGLYGFFDLFGGDMDQRGHGGGVKSEGGYGEVAPGHKTKIGGEIVKIPDKKIPDFQQTTGMTMEDWMKRNEEMQLRVGKEKFKQEQMARMPDLMHAAFGGSYATAAAPGNANLAQIAANSRAYQFGGVNIPTRTNFAALLG
tara:strand:- start:40 stop:672 length:633 start_codon:yes stop_codon:yes gene_type:complete